jgi:SAM dependent carboxyl methyltransferase
MPATISASSSDQITVASKHKPSSYIEYCLSRDFIRRALDAIQCDNQLKWSLLHIANFGVKDGRNSIPVSFAISQQLRASGYTQPILFHHDDLPTNNFTALFTGFDKLPDCENVFTFIIGRSFYQTCVPDGTLTFAFSSVFHCMSKVPRLLDSTTSIHSKRVPDDVRQLWRSAAQQDWLTILKARSQEMKVGAVLMISSVIQPSCNEDVQICELERDVFLLMRSNRVAPFDDTHPESVKRQDEAIRSFTLPCYRRTYDELIDKSVLEQAHLEIIFSEPHNVPNPLWQAHVEHSRFILEYIDIIRVAHSTYVKTALAPLCGDERQLKWVVDRYFEYLFDMICGLIMNDQRDKRPPEQGVIRQLAKDEVVCFMAVRKIARE